MEPVKGDLEIGIVIDVEFQGLLDDIRTGTFCFFGNIVQLNGKLFRESN